MNCPLCGGPLARRDPETAMMPWTDDGDLECSVCGFVIDDDSDAVDAF